MPVAGTAAIAGKGGSAGTKMTIRMDEELAGRVRAAWLARIATGQRTTLSGFVSEILEDAIAGIEAANGGRPFAPLEAGMLPHGRAV